MLIESCPGPASTVDPGGSGESRPIRTAESAARWVERHRAVVFPYHDPSANDRRLLTIEDLVHDTLPSQVEQLVGNGTPRPAAGMYLTGWYVGVAASFLGLSLAASGAGYLLGRDSTLWWRHPAGYADALEIAEHTRAVVLYGHEWSGRAGVRTVATRSEQAELVVAALVETVTPMVDTLQRLTRAGRIGLWHEVGDAIGGALVHQDTVPSTPETVDLLRGLVAASAGPWKRQPRIELYATDHGRVCVTHKGGCCMAFTVASTEIGGDGPDLDADHSAFQEAFPRAAGRPDYCATCKFRPFDESARMQVWWRERERLAKLTT